MRALLLVLILMVGHLSCVDLDKDQKLELLEGIFSGAVSSKPASEGYLKNHPSFKADSCLQGLSIGEKLATNVVSLIFITLKTDDLQMTIRAVREVGEIALELVDTLE